MRCKKTIDARSFSHQALEEMRIAAVQRVEAGESPEAVATGLGINRRTIYRWLASYFSGGIEALKAKPIPGAPSKLNARQARAARETANFRRQRAQGLARERSDRGPRRRTGAVRSRP